MRYCVGLGLAILLGGEFRPALEFEVSVLPPPAQQEEADAKGLPAPSFLDLTVLPLPAIDVSGDRWAVSEADALEIESLIEDLALIEDPCVGLSPTMSGGGFAPIPEAREFRSGILMIDHGLRTHEAMVRLVEWGPKALPFLLDAIDDARPTKLVLSHVERHGKMWHAREVPINPAAARERSRIAGHPRIAAYGVDMGWFDSAEGSSRHVVTIGDVAFVAIGQITNRRYEASRYQPSFCTVVNSPTASQEIAAFVKDVWREGSAPPDLFRSFLQDFHTRGSGSESLQIGAALRLLYYWPEAAGSLIVERLDGFEVGWDWEKVHARNQVDTAGFLRTVAAVGNPRVDVALANILRRTDNPSLFTAGLTERTVGANRKLVWRKMREFVDEWDGPIVRTYGREETLLRRAVRFFPLRARVLFETHAGRGSNAHVRGTIGALRDTDPEAIPWAASFLARLLSDQRDTHRKDSRLPGAPPMRICDEAAEVILEHLGQQSCERLDSLTARDAHLESVLRVVRERAIELQLPPFEVPASFRKVLTPERAPTGQWRGFVLEGFHYDDLTISPTEEEETRFTCRFLTHTDVGDTEWTVPATWDRGVLRFATAGRKPGESEPWTGLLLFSCDGEDHLVAIERAWWIATEQGIRTSLGENGWAYSRIGD